MTNAEAELERLKGAFEKFVFSLYPGNMDADADVYVACHKAAKLFFPFVAYALSDMQGSAEKTAMLNRFKASLGMELMAHERFFGDEK